MTAPVLELIDVVLDYRTPSGTAIRAVDGVSLAAHPGELVCVAGRSGAGKTSLLMLAIGVARPQDGEVLWNGSSITGLGVDELAHLRGGSMGIVLQSGALIDSLTASENVALAAMPSGANGHDVARADQLLARLGVDGRSDHYPWQLSGGEQQRVALARALFRQPQVLIIDEPTANLDRASSDAIADVLVGLRDEGRALLVASHDQHLLERADRVVELE